MAQTLNTPQVLNQPIANNGDKNVIPNTNDQSTGLMSMSAGFPPVTSQRIADGGIPPRRSDVNGALNLISQQHYFLQNGGTYTFRQDVSNAIGGYPKNAILYYEDPDGNLTLVRSLVENNTNNFVNDPSLIDGVNWERLSLGIANANIGQIIQVACAPDYTPFGTLPCDGSQYSSSRFPTLWQNYLTADTPLLNTCTLEEWEAEVASSGQCLKFAVDTTTNVFKVPLIKDGTHLQQALTDDELSKFYSDGLPALDLSTVGAHTHTRGTMNITGGPIHINAYGPGNITSGAFRTVATGASHNDSGGTGVDIYFNASNAWTGATSSNGDHTHTFTSSKIGKYNTVQPVAFGIRFFVVVANAVRNESMMDWSQWQSDLQGKMNNDLSNIDSLGLTKLIPTGSVISFAGNSNLDGYIICNGAEISRETYSNLFDIIGTTYGSGDGSTTFNVPDLTDRFIQGSGTAGSVKNAGLPNISGTANFGAGGTGERNSVLRSGNGVFSVRESVKGFPGNMGSLSGVYEYLDFNARNSNSIYGNSSTVQPPALTMRYYIKY